MFKSLFDKALEWHRLNHLERLDWITRNTLIIQKGKNTINKLREQSNNLPTGKKCLFWATTAWERGGLEHMLAFSLQMRGCDIKGVRCGGGYPACGMESIFFKKPDCDYCQERSKTLLDIFDLSDYYTSTNRFIKQERIEEITKISLDLSLEELLDFQIHGIHLGNIIIRDMPQYYFKLIDPKDPIYEERLRNSFVSTLIYFEAAREAIKQEKPEVGFVSNGKTIGFTGFYEACISLGVPVITWDGSVSGPDTFIFKWNNYANEYHLEDAWENLKAQPLEKKEEQFLEQYFKLTVKGTFGRAQYYNDPIYEKNTIRDQLGLKKGNTLVAMLCNLTWDTSTLGRDVGFESMHDWIISTIDACIPQTGIDLVIRCHPAEGHSRPEARSQELVSDIIASHYPNLPSHIHVISGHDEINSHSLSNMADMISVYSTTVGLEMATRGRLVHICGDSHYRGKGFTEDIETKESYLKLFEGSHTIQRGLISKEQIQLSKKYAYLFLVRSQVCIPEFRQPTRHTFEIKDVNDLLPGGSERWDGLCDSVMNSKPFYNLAPLIPPWEKS